jgi:hypothetical protein
MIAVPPSTDTRSFTLSRLIRDAAGFFGFEPYIAAGGLWPQNLANEAQVKDAYETIETWLETPVGQTPVPPSHAIPQFPVISRGLPYASSQGGQFGGPNDEANAIDADYRTTWNSVFSTMPQWYALDLRAALPADRSNVWCVIKHWGGNYYEPTATLGITGNSVFASLPRNYKLQAHSSSGALPPMATPAGSTSSP